MQHAGMHEWCTSTRITPRFAMRDARRILNCWWREGCGVTPVLRLRELTVDEYLGAYRDHVVLAATLADYRSHIAAAHGPRGLLVDELHRRVATAFADRCGSPGALEQWVCDQRLAMRRPTGPIARLLHPGANAR
jgi:hypothetical protein